jgi:hypothetical protein
MQWCCVLKIRCNNPLSSNVAFLMYFMLSFRDEYKNWSKDYHLLYSMQRNIVVGRRKAEYRMK